MPIGSLAILANPLARKGTGLSIAADVERLLRARGVDVQVLAGTDLADAQRLAAQAVADEKVDVLVAVGGDGTIRLALEAAAGSSTPVGVIPAGTGNDLARTLGVPLGDLDAAVAIIVDGESRAIDLGRVSLGAGSESERAESNTGAGSASERAESDLGAGSADTIFVTVAATGFDADVTDRANKLSWPRGKARYLVAAVAEIARLRPRRFTVRVDGQVLADGDVIFTAIGNTRSYGGGMLITPRADIGDGELDVTVATMAPGVGRGTLLRLLPTVFKGTHVDHELVRTGRGKKIEVSSDPPALVSVDGDLIGHTPAIFETLPAAVQVRVPR